MGVYRLEIDPTDELIEAVDRLSLKRRSSSSDVVVATLTDHLTSKKEIPISTIADRLAALEHLRGIAGSLGHNRSQVREHRADRTFDR